MPAESPKRDRQAPPDPTALGEGNKITGQQPARPLVGKGPVLVLHLQSTPRRLGPRRLGMQLTNITNYTVADLLPNGAVAEFACARITPHKRLRPPNNLAVSEEECRRWPPAIPVENSPNHH
jgi:hypothetical protein